MTTTEPTPAQRRGYPLPPWAVEPLAGVEPTPADVDEYLGTLDTAQRVAYLGAWLERHRQAQDTASRCHLEDHAGWPEAYRVLDELLLAARADRAAAVGVANELERTVVAQAEALRALEELYVAAHRPAVIGATDVDEDDERYDVVTVRLAYDRLNADAAGLGEEARHRIAEAAAVAAHAAYERELADDVQAVEVTTLEDAAPRFELVRTPPEA